VHGEEQDGAWIFNGLRSPFLELLFVNSEDLVKRREVLVVEALSALLARLATSALSYVVAYN